jgi:stearoyl-CoA desaturase (delta-9 desaturase)
VAYHRSHHRNADREGDPHSPVEGGFWFAHCGWLFGRDHMNPDRAAVKDLTKCPELAWLDRLWMLPGLLFAALCFAFQGWGGVLGYCLAVVFVFHVTFAINSVAHTFGPRRFATADASRNNAVLGVLALGEGWHNNHHRAPHSARHGFAWYELDVSYQLIRVLAWLGLVWDVKLPPPELMAGEKPREGANTPAT